MVGEMKTIIFIPEKTESYIWTHRKRICDYLNPNVNLKNATVIGKQINSII